MGGLYIETWGCQMNEYDSKRMAELLNASHQLELTDNIDKAKVLLMNTCSIREKASEKVFSRLGQWRKLKEANPDLIIGVGGCVASQEGALIQKRAPYVDIVFGPQTLHRLPELIEKAKKRQPAIDISFPEIEKFDRLPDPKAEGPVALVSIQEGCSKYCKYCIVPFTRGEEINRPFDDVVTEISILADQGVKEITLLGQNVNAYRSTMVDTPVDLGVLIRFIAEIDGIERIRFTTSHPIEFNDSLIEAYRDIPKLADHLHLPVQSGSDRILMQMGRQHTTLEYKAIIHKLRQVRPDIPVSSDFIVGYPGETDEDFEQTLQFVRDIGFDNSFSFIFSPRPGTPAAALPDETPMEIKKERLQKLQDLLNAQGYQISRRMIGQVYPVLITGPSPKDPMKLTSRTESNRIVILPCHDQALIGKIVPVRIVEVLPRSLRGELV